MISPFHVGGNTKGYVRGLAVKRLIEAVDSAEVHKNRIKILDAGCGLGELSVYLACKGFSVVGVDISYEACQSALELSKRVGVSDRCYFLAESLGELTLSDKSIDYIIGHAALHHFIKYNVSSEFYRIMKNNALAFFSDSFGENPIYRLFHNKDKMKKLGDVILTKRLIEKSFREFRVQLTPTDWFVMIDKLYLKLFNNKLAKTLRYLSRLHYSIDRKMPSSNRILLFLSGSVMTRLEKRDSIRTKLT